MDLFSLGHEKHIVVYVGVQEVYAVLLRFTKSSNNSTQVKVEAEDMRRIGVPYGSAYYEKTLHTSLVRAIKSLKYEAPTTIILEPSFLDLCVSHGNETFADSVTVDNGLIREIIGKEAPLRPGMVMVDQCVLSVRLNGYPVQQPEGKEASVIDADCLSTFGEKSFTRNLIKIVHDTVGDTPRVVSFELAAAAYIRNLYPQEINYSVITIGWKDSGIIIERNGLFTEAHPIRYSSRQLREKIAPLVPGGSLSFVDSYISLFNDENLNERGELAIQESIRELCNESVTGGYDSSFNEYLKEHKDTKTFVVAPNNEVRTTRLFLSGCRFSNLIFVGKMDVIAGIETKKLDLCHSVALSYGAGLK